MVSRFSSLPLRGLHRPSLRGAPPVLRRHASGNSAPSAARFLSTTTILLATGGALVAYYYDSRSLLHEHVVMPFMRLFDPETGHKAAVRLLSSRKWVRPKDKGLDGPELEAEIFGMRVSNPVGMAAGFDKDADAIDGLFDLGFGYVEIGSVTPEPQPGNPTPRFFRLEEDGAAINRYGFNSLGHGHALARLKARVLTFSRDHPSLFPSQHSLAPLPPAGLPRSLRPGCILAVNLGKNKTSHADSNDDYVRGVRTLGPYADVVVINVSSPNTPGLRALQGREVLERLLRDVVEERDRIAGGTGLPKIAVKVACDLGEEELADVAAAVRKSGVEGVIVSNTTIRRNELDLQSDNQDQIGGLSGRPLFPYALRALQTLRPLLPPTIPILGCGGITTGSDAMAMASAGASLVQLYTSFGYRGVGTPRLLKDEISAELAGGMWKQAVGRDWAGKEMGWDEKRLEQESEALRKEAEGLGELLRKAWEEDDTARLVKEAQEALSDIKVPSGNLAGAPDVAERHKEAVQGLMEAATQPQMQAIETAPAVSIEAEQLLTIGTAVVPEPVTAPVEIKEIEVTPVLEQEDTWTSAVRSGQRRLV